MASRFFLLLYFPYWRGWWVWCVSLLTLWAIEVRNKISPQNQSGYFLFPIFYLDQMHLLHNAQCMGQWATYSVRHIPVNTQCSCFSIGRFRNNGIDDIQYVRSASNVSLTAGWDMWCARARDKLISFKQKSRIETCFKRWTADMLQCRAPEICVRMKWTEFFASFFRFSALLLLTELCQALILYLSI